MYRVIKINKKGLEHILGIRSKMEDAIALAKSDVLDEIIFEPERIHLLEPLNPKLKITIKGLYTWEIELCG